MWRFNEVRNVRRHSFEDYSLRLSLDEQQALQLVLSAMKVLLLQVLSPKRVAGLGGPDGMPELQSRWCNTHPDGVSQLSVV
ncbi:MAG: hypothetical protein DMG13_03765 [Acidobacteria bacterium]|nr:MAG: hypothetical protein DMG13_03765 [Acidobacteriota bacterium]